MLHWGTAALGIGYWYLAAGAMSLSLKAGITVAGHPFFLPTALIDFIAGAILVSLAGRRIVISRRQPASLVPLSPVELGALFGFAAGGLLGVFVFWRLVFSGLAQFGLYIGLTHWAPLGLVAGAMLTLLASGISRARRRPT